jgi:hypothetical protein
MPLPLAEEKVLDALRSQAEWPPKCTDKDGGKWVKVKLADAENTAGMEPRTFQSIINTLKLKKLYKKIDEEHGWVDAGEEGAVGPRLEEP